MAPLLADELALEYDIIAIQEPWRNPFQNTTFNPVKDRFDLIYMDDRKTRVCFFVNKKLSGSWAYTHHSPDYAALVLNLQARSELGTRKIHIHNVYNPSPTRECPFGTLPLLHESLLRNSSAEHVVLGDFNLHHPLWGGDDIREPHREADFLLTIIEEQGLDLLLPQGTRTRQQRGQHTTIDLVFATALVTDSVITCGLGAEQLDHDSDHLPISTILGLGTREREREKVRRWRLLDKQTLLKSITEALPLPTRPESVAEIEQVTEGVVRALTEAIDLAVPSSQPSARSIPGWTPEIKEAQMQVRRLRRDYQRARTEEAWEAYRVARNKKGRLIKKLLRQAHRERVEMATASPEGLWKLAKWAKTGTSRPTYTPPIRRQDGEMESDPSKKADLMQEAFFPELAEADLRDIAGYEYPTPVDFPAITEQEIERAIRQASPRKAPGPDGIPNHILQTASAALIPTLCPLYNACLEQGHCPRHFRDSITVALRKPGKENYTAVKSYRPVALLNTLGKILDSIIASRISYVVEKHSLIPYMHMGGRKCRSTDHAIHLLLERIYAARSESPIEKVATVLSLDVTGAFDNVSHRRLLHNLRKRSIDHKTVEWIGSFLTKRSTRIRLQEITTEPRAINTGIPQGSPLSPVLYLFYNSDLLESCEDTELGTFAVGYIDDVNIVTISESTESNCQRLATVYNRCQTWERQHASKFSPSKYSLIHIAKRPSRFNLDCSLVLPDSNIIRPTGTSRFLGIVLDAKLNWREHIKQIQSRASISIAALYRIAGSTWGTGYTGLRQIYRSVVIPQLLYGCSAWYTPMPYGQIHKRYIVETLSSIQARAARVITGAFRATSRPALDIEAGLLPIKLQLERTASSAFLRIAASPLYARFLDMRRTRYRIQLESEWHHWPQRWSPLECHLHWCQKALGQTALQELEVKVAYSAAPWWKPPNVEIDQDPRSAISRHDEAIKAGDGTLAIYTDGSGINGKVGAAAVVPLLHRTKQAYMGQETASNVYAAELCGVQMALTIAEEVDYARTLIFTDSQAALRCICTPGRTSGQYILLQIINHLDRLREMGKAVELCWIPAHEGVPGNEDADRAAKEATGWRSVRRQNGRRLEYDTEDTAPQPTGSRHLLSAIKTSLKRQAREKWEESWEKETRGRDLFRIAPHADCNTPKLHRQLSRPLSSILTQLRTGKIGLRQYLHSRQVPGIEDGLCRCGFSQTITHILFNCRLYTDQREGMWTEEEGEGRIRKRRIYSIRLLLNTPTSAKRAAKFMRDTGLLGQFRSFNGEN